MKQSGKNGWCYYFQCVTFFLVFIFDKFISFVGKFSKVMQTRYMGILRMKSTLWSKMVLSGILTGFKLH